MKIIIPLMIILSLILGSACKTEKKDDIMNNPLVQNFDTPFKVPPFEKIKLEHFLPAIKYAINEQEKEIDSIVNNEEKATFTNTVEALDLSGNLLKEVNLIFNNFLSANTNEGMRKLAKEIAPLNSNHTDNILLNTKLYARIKEVYDGRDTLDLNTEQYTLLDEIYKKFTRGGANLNEPIKKNCVK